MKDRFLSALSNERKFPEVGANSIVSSVACGLSRECENERADSHTQRVHTQSHTHTLTHKHTRTRTEKRGCAEGGVTYFPPFRLREFNALSVPRLGADPRENDFIIHEMQNALGSLEKYRAISRKSKSRYRVLVLNATCLRFTRGYSASVSVEFTVPEVCARRNVRHSPSAAARLQELIDVNFGTNKQPRIFSELGDLAPIHILFIGCEY